MKGKFGYHLLALAVVAVWGVTFISTKILIGEGLDPSWIFAVRFALAYLGIWVFYGASPHRSSGGSDRSAGVCPERAGVCPERAGVCPERAGVCLERAGVCPERVGVCPERASVCPERASVCPERVGVCPERASVATDCGVAVAADSGVAVAADCGRRASPHLLSRSLRDELLFVFLGVTGGSAYFLCENSALACTQACNVSFIVCSAPLFTVLLTLLARRVLRGELAAGLEDVSGRWQLPVGTALALAGMAAVVFDGSELHLSVHGDILALAAALCWALYSVFMGQMAAKYGALFATRKVFFYGLLTIAPFLLTTAPDPSIFARPQVWGNLLFLAVVASFGCFILWNRIMSVIGNVTATNYVYLNPFFTLVAAVLLLGESLSLQSALGCAGILGGVILACLVPTLSPTLSPRLRP